MTEVKYYNNIVVPLDGSRNSKLAFRRALTMAEDRPVKLHLVHVIDEAADLTSVDDVLVTTLSHRDNKMLNKCKAIAAKHHVNADTMIECGPPKALIAYNFVNYFHANLIVMGANGLGHLKRLLMGSVAVYVSREAPCDVLVVKEK